MVALILVAVTGEGSAKVARHEAIAAGAFEVTMAPAAAPDPAMAVWTLARTFHGDLSATSVGQMLSAGDPAKGAAGYVAVEQVTGTLAGRTGGFAYQHSGTMTVGTSSLAITVVPGSATGGLTGLAGTMAIAVADGQHRYTFRYTLPD